MVFIIFFTTNLFNNYLKTKIIERKQQFLYFFLAVNFYSFSAINFIPNYNFDIYPYGVYSLWFFGSFIYYAISKYNLMSLNTFSSYATVNLILSGYAFISWASILYFEKYFIAKSIFSTELLITNFILVTIFIHTLILLFKKSSNWAKEFFEHFNTKEHLSSFFTDLEPNSTDAEIRKYILNKIALILKADVGLVIREKNNNYALYTSDNCIFDYSQDVLDNLFFLDNKIITKTDINLKPLIPDSNSDILRKTINHNLIGVLMKIQNNTNDQILIVKNKNDNKPFYIDEVDFLLQLNHLIKDKL